MHGSRDEHYSNWTAVLPPTQHCGAADEQGGTGGLAGQDPGSPFLLDHRAQTGPLNRNTIFGVALFLAEGER